MNGSRARYSSSKLFITTKLSFLGAHRRGSLGDRKMSSPFVVRRKLGHQIHQMLNDSDFVALGDAVIQLSNPLLDGSKGHPWASEDFDLWVISGLESWITASPSATKSESFRDRKS